jgi:hypothetical protein
MPAYKPAGIHIVHQHIAGEVIVVDLEKGSYFSLLATSVFIWESIVNGLSREGLLDETKRLYDGNAVEMEQAVDSFITRLLEEGLIVETAGSDNKVLSGEMNKAETKLQFKAPQLHRYDDMADVLALDPIHDFDEAGWPNQPVTTR